MKYKNSVTHLIVSKFFKSSERDMQRNVFYNVFIKSLL